MPDPASPFPDDVPDMRIPERDPVSGGGGSRNPHDGYSLEGETAAARAGWKKGDRVLAPWEPMFLYAGTIDSLSGARALIEFDDGDSGWVELRHMQPLRVKPGQRVLSRRRMGPHFFPAEIREVNGEDLRVAFDDGHNEETTVAAVRIPCEPKGRGAEHLQTRSNTAFVKHLRTGDRVWALWQNSALFVGTVRILRDDDAHIRFDDGDQAWVRLEHMMPLELMVGMFVMGRWQMGPNFHPGTITDVDEGGDRVHIRYDDGDEEWTTPAALALPLQPAPGPTPAPGPRPQHAAPPAAIQNAAAGWNPRVVIVVGGIAIALVALLFFWLGRH